MGMSLTDLTKDINTVDLARNESIGEVLEKSRILGGLLLDAKKLVKHGEWGRYLMKDTTVSPRKARRCMQFYTAAKGLPYRDFKRLQPVWDHVQGNAPQEKPDSKLPNAKSDVTSILNSEDEPESEPAPEPRPPGKTDATSDLKERQQVEAKRTEQLVDGDGRPVPPHLEDVFREAEAFREWSTRISSLKREVTVARKDDPAMFKQFREQPFNAGLKQAVDQLNLSAPFIVCSYCGGLDSENCTGCKGCGFLSRAQARCVPRELREAD